MSAVLDPKRIVQEVEDRVRDLSNDEIIQLIAKSVRNFFSGSENDRNAVVKGRKEFELATYSEIAGNVAKQSAVCAEAVPIHEEMQDIVESGNVGIQNQARFTKLDSAFHAKLCEIAGYGDFVRLIELLPEAIGNSLHHHEPSELQSIVDEHSEILEAILAPAPDDKQIAAVVESHVAESEKRWLNSRQRGGAGMEASNPIERRFLVSAHELFGSVSEWMRQGIRDTAEMAADILGDDPPQLQIDFLLNDLHSQEHHGGKYVAFTECEVQSRLERKILFVSQSMKQMEKKLRHREVASTESIEVRYYPAA